MFRLRTSITTLVSKKRLRRYYVRSKDLKQSIFKMFLLLLVLCSVHIALMVDLEEMVVGDAIWLTLTTATTVGYGDFSAKTPLGRTGTIVLLYLGGIFIFSKIISDIVDIRAIRRDLKLKGLWRWMMQDHILIINTPKISWKTSLPLKVTSSKDTR